MNSARMPDTWPLIVRDVRRAACNLLFHHSDPAGLTLLALAEDMEQRDRIGVDKYGVPLRPFNGRDSLLDAYEESLDLVAYLANDAIEGNFPPTSCGLLKAAAELCFSIKQTLNERLTR